MQPIEEAETAAATEAEVVFPATSEMGMLCRQKDWSGTGLGPVEDWPQPLKTAASTVVRQGIAQNLCWGPDLLQIYNDAYRTIMGEKHPEGLGRSVLWSWAEISADIQPLFDRIWGGETVYFEDFPLRVMRHGGEMEDAYFTFSYSPVSLENGDVGGVLINCYETTDQVHARAVQRDRDRLLAELEVERARLEYVFTRAPAFLAVLRGSEHTFDLVNDAYYQLVGHREIVGKPVGAALPEVVEQGFVALLDQVLETGEPFIARELPVMLARVTDAPPEQRFVDLSYMPLLEADGTRSGVVAHGTDVTDQVLARRRIEDLLRESEMERAEAEAARADADAARVEAENANSAKADFLASMSHELRTPLNVIGGYVELMQMGIHGPVTPAQLQTLARVRNSQEHLLSLINDVLAFAKIEAGQIHMESEALRVKELILNLEPLVAPLAEAKGIELTAEECDAALVVIADEERVRQILLNLVGNAIKFTPPAGWVKVTCEQKGEWVEIGVHDNGPGIPPDKQQSIFDPFVQVERRLSNPRDGVGLGLAISRDLARAMGGDLSVRSEVGAGSEFVLRLKSE